MGEWALAWLLCGIIAVIRGGWAWAMQKPSAHHMTHKGRKK